MKTDFVVIGSGIAGLSFALEASKMGKVIILTKKNLTESSTQYAQGGIAAVLSPNDSFEAHIEDTLKAGCYHNNREAVELLVREGPAKVRKLFEMGTQFDQKDGELLLTREGCHRCHRVAFSGDTTGLAIERTLSEHIRRETNIEVIENALVIDLLMHDGRCGGLLFLHEGKILSLFARAIILASGGTGQLYRKTTNPEVATGDGVAMAHRIGAETGDLEFMQFHPTVLDKQGSPYFLISEAVRGEGGRLVNSLGERFMPRYHEMAELAPRDVMARAIVKESEYGKVYLDIRHVHPELIKKRFPTIFSQLLQNGINMNYEKVPVLPAAHYMCGGVRTNLLGETSIPGLYACGEVACTGVHGANRLASNSLLEGLVFGHQVVKAMKSLQNEIREFGVDPLKLVEADVSQIRKEIREIMWEKVGLMRNAGGLTESARRLKEIEDSLPTGINADLIEVRNMAITGGLIARAALNRKKSLGCHTREDSE